MKTGLKTATYDPSAVMITGRTDFAALYPPSPVSSDLLGWQWWRSPMAVGSADVRWGIL